MQIKYWEMLSDKESKAVGEEAMRIRWGFTPKTIRKQYNRFVNGSIKVKAMVCALLEECNYHTLCGYLSVNDTKSALEWIDREMPLDKKPVNKEEETIEAYIAEISKGKYMTIKKTDDGDGTYAESTDSPWLAEWDTDLDHLKGVVGFEYYASKFEKDYPKYHKVRFTYEVIDKDVD